MHQRAKDFIGFATSHLIENGTSVSFTAVKKTEWGAAGSFDEGELEVATKRKDWFPIFVHEYCHFLQHLDETSGTPVGYPLTSGDEYTRLWGGLHYPTPDEPVLDVSDAEFRGLCRKVQLMERENDGRVMALISEHELPIDVASYSRQANAYHLFYEYVAKHRRWGDKPIWDVPGIVKAMPDVLIKPGTWKLTQEMERTINRHCFKSRSTAIFGPEKARTTSV